MTASDIQQRLLENDETALKLLYEEYGNQLLQFAFAVIPLRPVAEEIVADVFIKVWEKRQRIATVENLKMYLYITTRNIAYSYYRKYNRKRTVDLDELTLPYYQIDNTPEDALITAEVLQAIHEAVNNLPPKCKLVFKLVKEDGLKYREVAELLELTPKTVENQIAIALKKIHAAVAVHLPNFYKSPLRRIS